MKKDLIIALDKLENDGGSKYEKAEILVLKIKILNDFELTEKENDIIAYAWRKMNGVETN